MERDRRSDEDEIRMETMEQDLLLSCPWVNITVLGKTSTLNSVEIEGCNLFTRRIPIKWPTADYIVNFIDADDENGYDYVMVHDRDFTKVEFIYDVSAECWIDVEVFDSESNTFSADEYMNRAKFLVNK